MRRSSPSWNSLGSSRSLPSRFSSVDGITCRLGSGYFSASAFVVALLVPLLELGKDSLFVGHASSEWRLLRGHESGDRCIPSIAGNALHSAKDESIERVGTEKLSLGLFLLGCGGRCVGFRSSLVLGPIVWWHGHFEVLSVCVVSMRG